MNDDSFITKGNPLISRKKIKTIQDVDKELDNIIKEEKPTEIVNFITKQKKFLLQILARIKNSQHQR